MPSITASVGVDGDNRPADVKVVQRLLNRWAEDLGLDRRLEEHGFADRDTVIAIVEFQGRVVGMTTPDGRVDPGGATLRFLNRGPGKFAPLPASGTGYYTYLRDERRFGTRKTLASVRRAGREMASIGLEIGVGNISLEEGGRMPPHSSHQRGLEVDFRPLRTDQRRRPVTIHDARYSRDDTESLVEILHSDSNLELILFNDSTIPGVRPWAGHDNHLHARFKS